LETDFPERRLPLAARLFRRTFALALAMVICLFPMSLHAQKSVTVFAAASLKSALDEVAAHYSGETATTLRVSYAGSSALARQIQYGAPAQIFLSANTAWMDVVQDEGLLAEATRVDVLTNRLVLIGALGVEEPLTIAPGFDLAGSLADARLAMALVDAVPAGIYGRAALQSLGVWNSVRHRVAQTDNVRAALRLVALGEARLGIVYATDAGADPRVHLLGVFPADSHPPILYPAAVLKEGDTPEARAFLAFLTGDVAGTIFRRHGFARPGEY